jgi:two-component system nitrate/nitrite response regulator NarL
MPVRVFIAEDHPVYRRGLTDALNAGNGIDLVGEAGEGPEALERLRELEPDVALLDLQLPGLSGIEILKQLVAGASPTRVVLLSGHAEPALVFEAIDAGATGFLSKEESESEICKAVLAAAAGQTVLSPGMDADLVRQIGSHARRAELSGREREIMILMTEGLTSSEIALRLNLSEGTVKTYTARAYEKLGVTNRAAAVAEAMRRGIAR